jgi:hypothetical protein
MSVLDKKKIINSVLWVVIFSVIVLNGVLLLKLKKNTLEEPPLSFMEIKKPTLVLILDENECASCIWNLEFLNGIYTHYYNEGSLDFAAIILSKTKVDPKGIKKAFIFPCYTTDDFRILKRFNLNHTPVLLGITPEHQVVYSELIPFGTSLTEQYLKKGIIDRLYYSLTMNR